MDNSKDNIQFMKQYLKDLYILEKNRYCSEQVKQKYDNIINNLGKPNNEIEHCYKPKEPSFSEQISFKIKKIISGICCGVLFGIIGFIVCLFAVFFLGMFSERVAIIGTGVILVIFIIAILLGFYIGFSTPKNEYHLANIKYENYQNELKKDNERIKKELEQSKAYIEKRAPFIKNIHSCNEALNQLYSLDIIFPKYRNFIAISQIYEYFMSGRCTELEGHEGAYNIFESELRQNIIINKLNDVLNQLEQIKQNQYMIYQAICEANSHLAKIESNTEAIKYNTAVIAENSAICARYAESGGNRYY